MRFNVHGGHSLKCRGASGYLDEVNEDRKVKNRVIELLRANGHTVYDCTDDGGASQNANLKAIVNKCNAHSVDLDVSIHLNSGRNDSIGDGKIGGVEVWVYSQTSKSKPYADRICQKVASELQMTNRGTKYCGNNLYVIRKTKSPALLIECCFVDDKDDAVRWNADKCAKAIVEGILNKSVTESKAPSANTTSNNQQLGTYVVTAKDGLKVRKGPGTNYDRKAKNELTPDAQKHSNVNGGLLYGTRVTVSEFKNGWAKIPSGWVSANYLKKA